MTGIIGRKLGMAQIFDEKGSVVPVTVIEAGPCKIIQVKTKENDGYEAVQIGFDEINKKITKPMDGHFRKVGSSPYRVLAEFPMRNLNVGDVIDVERFKKGERIIVSGISKGKGFQGVMKRHGFSGGPGSHGSMFNRAPGSIGSSTYPSRVWKNLGMPGQMGNRRVSAKNLKVIDVKPDQNLLLIKGAVPGPNGGYLKISKEY